MSATKFGKRKQTRPSLAINCFISKTLLCFSSSGANKNINFRKYDYASSTGTYENSFYTWRLKENFISFQSKRFIIQWISVVRGKTVQAVR